MLLALTLAAYALAMTVSRGNFGPVNMALLLGVVVGIGLFVLAERNAASPLIRLQLFRDPVLSASLAMSVLVATVLLMGGSTFCIGLLPTYQNVGVWAAGLLIALRLLQGFGAGAEQAGASLIVSEFAPRERRGFYARPD